MVGIKLGNKVKTRPVLTRELSTLFVWADSVKTGLGDDSFYCLERSSMDKSLWGLRCPERMRTAENGTLKRAATISRTRVFARFLCAGSLTEISRTPFLPSSIFSFFAPGVIITFTYILSIQHSNILQNVRMFS